MTFWTYILHCHDGAFYTGHTDNLDRRLVQHEHGSLPGFTRDKLPIKLVWSASFETRADALAMEQRIKGWSRAKETALIRGDRDDPTRFAKGQK